MAHRPRVSHVVLTRYTNKPEQLDYFMNEMENIRDSEGERPADDLNTSSGQSQEEENDQEENAMWLKKAGFTSMVNFLENSHDDETQTLELPDLETQTAALPKAHAAIIRQRMHTFRTTIKSRQGSGRGVRRRGSGLSDVRQLFTDNKETVVASNEQSIQLISVQVRKSTPSLELPSSSPPPSPPPSSDIDSPTGIHPKPHPPTPTEPHPSTPPISIEPHPSTPPPSNSSVQSKSNSSSPETIVPNYTDIKLTFSCLTSFTQLSKSESLPSISLDPDILGVTEVGDLSPGDMEKIQCLAHIELTITFEENNIPLRTLRTPKLRNIGEERQFGTPLSVLLQNDRQRQPRTELPLLFKEMIEFLETNGAREEGILRISGSKQRIKDLQEEIEICFNSGAFCFDGRKPADVAVLLKQFIRELPLPLLTHEHLPAFASIADISDLKEQIRTLNLLMLILPPLHQSVLKRLLQFCEKIHKETEHNKMNLTNVSMVLAPNLFHRLPASKLGCDDVTLAAKTSHVVLLMIRYHRVLWTIPSGMLTQVRFLNELELKKLNKRHVKQVLQKMNNTEQSAKKAETSNNIIKVKTPFFTSFSKVVNIQENPTAGSVIAKLRKRAQLNIDIIRRYSTTSIGDVSLYSEDGTLLDELGDDFDMREQCLYETGGNIGERRLDPNTNMLALYEVNPGAEWVIKPRNCNFLL